MSAESEGVGRDLRTGLLCGLEEVQAEVRQLRMVVDTSMESIAHQLLAQSTKEVSPKFLISRCFIYLTDFVGVLMDQEEFSSVTYSTELTFA